MKTVLLILNICCLLLFSCGDDKGSQTITDSESSNQKTAITARAIENFDYTDYVLSENAESIVIDWEKYQEFAIQISYLKKADLSFFNGDKKILKTFITEFKETTSDTLQTNPILSRMGIIETKLLKLNENLTIDNIDGATKLQGVKEMLIAFSDLNYQINKKLERDIYDKIVPE